MRLLQWALVGAILALGYGCTAPSNGTSTKKAIGSESGSAAKPSKQLAPGDLDEMEAQATPVTFAPAGAASQSSPEAAESYVNLFEAERVAAEVYAVLAEKWDGRPFSKIMEAEKTHLAAVSGVLARMGAKAPHTEAGKYEMEEFQALYDSMVKRGSTSRKDAMEVGAEIEEMSIRDLLVWREAEKDPAVQKVLDNLIRGSSNHLKAFVRGRKALGMPEYEAKYLSKEEFKMYSGETK